ncbi:sporulation initiation phosphotransferase F [Cystobacter fuscus DSM 2262]|uniref:Sporulation initiation phosphotransferase F n=1 Tax=Cystobacter fuscus (strain ATCC 25194 / DSM 2262 / NBRC 100088 / M29) TaxID=1242864 RepID=S9PIR7_CYSF2|nr:sporulation initiation phosphotransferase F [Cystobacter fuscus DSM 2262]
MTNAMRIPILRSVARAREARGREGIEFGMERAQRAGA